MSRVKLRKVRPGDKETIRRWRNMPEVSKYMYTDHEISVEEHDLWFDAAMHRPSERYWIIVSGARDVGLASLCNMDYRNSRCYWAFYVVDEERGRGVGAYVEYEILRYVFEELKFNKVCGEVLASNVNVLALHESFGFRVEGILREHVQKQSRFRDVVTIGLLRSEWKQLAPTIESRLREKGFL